MGAEGPSLKVLGTEVIALSRACRSPGQGQGHLLSTALATYAARAVQWGCRLPGQDRVNDVLSPLAQRRQHFTVASLPEYETVSNNPLSDALADNTQSPPDESVCFKLDFLGSGSDASANGIAVLFMI